MDKFRKMRNVHRPHSGELIYGFDLVEVDEDGVETVIPPELICRAKPTVLKDETLRWVPRAEIRRLDGILAEALETMMLAWVTSESDSPMTMADALQIAGQQGYLRVGVLHSSPDEDVIEHHVLCRDASEEHVDLVLVHWDEGYGYYLHHIDVEYRDKEQEAMILRLVDEADIALAREHGILCADEDGYHTQVRVYRSVLWQCEIEGALDTDGLRAYWSQQVRSSN